MRLAVIAKVALIVVTVLVASLLIHGTTTGQIAMKPMVSGAMVLCLDLILWHLTKAETLLSLRWRRSRTERDTV